MGHFFYGFTMCCKWLVGLLVVLLTGCVRTTAVTAPSATPTLEFTNSASTTCANPVPEDRRFPLPPWPKTNFCKHSVSYDEFRYGGVRRDTIPALDEPLFESVAAAELWLTEAEPVLVLQLGDDVRAYPIPILIWHEIVNDVVNGRAVVITYCPLCNAGLAFERVVNGQTLSFGASGNLRNADLVMYDRQTESWWQQFSGEAIVGEMTGSQLAPLPLSLVSFAQFKAQFPYGRVLSANTGYERPYGENPYINYDALTNPGVKFLDGEPDRRLLPKMRVMGVLIAEEAIAYPYDLLAEQTVVNDIVAEQPLVVFWQGGTNTPLYQQFIAEARDVGSSAVFSRELEGRVLTFGTEDGRFIDEQTGSQWNLFGTAVAGPLAGSQLTPLFGHELFWFAWATFQPKTTIYGE